MINVTHQIDELYDQVERMVVSLPLSLQEHINRTRDLASRLGEIHGVDGKRCALGALSHDLARHLEGSQLLIQSKEKNIPLNSYELDSPVLLHGPLAAVWLESELGCDDEEVVNSVRYHTTGRPCMTHIEKIVFIADKVEAEKLAENPELILVADKMEVDLDESILEYLKLRVKSLMQQKRVVHPLALETWNYLIQKE
ncbi:MAG: nicotinate-nucleotide adenylyltransferase [Chloroflexi bacterium]|nr:MAG: nicotinate-nucleotide adenylyltransferase [Chloroflexota bacterium]